MQVHAPMQFNCCFQCQVKIFEKLDYWAVLGTIDAQLGNADQTTATEAPRPLLQVANSNYGTASVILSEKKNVSF